MTLPQVLLLVIKVSIALQVFGIALQARVSDATSYLRRPALLVRALLSMYVVMFVLAVAVVLSLDLHPAIEIALVALALSPVPPTMPVKLLKAGSRTSTAVGLAAAMSLAAIVVVPLGVAIGGALIGKHVRMPIAPVVQIVCVAVLLPLVLGIALGRLAPAFAARIAPIVHRVAVLMLVLAGVPLLVFAWPAVRQMLGTGMLPALVMFSVVGVVAGHLLSDRDEVRRMVLAMSTATRHPGMAIAIAGVTYPDVHGVAAVAICHVVVSAIVVIPYLHWRDKYHGAGVT